MFPLNRLTDSRSLSASEFEVDGNVLLQPALVNLLTNPQFQDASDSEFLRVNVVVSWRYMMYILGLFLISIFATYITGAAVVRLIYSFGDRYECLSYCHYSPFRN